MGRREPMEALKRVWLIGGAGHSGSTLLGLILGSHDTAFYLGEAKKSLYLGDPRKPERKRSCKLCGPACPVWGGLQPEPGAGLYRQLAVRSGRPHLIDSTKAIGWLRPRIDELAAAGVDVAFLFLTRDGRAVINSRVRKYPDRDPARLIDDWVSQVRATRRLFDELRVPRAEVRYEELATEPERVIRDLCPVLGIDYQPGMLRYEEHEHHPLGGNTGTQYLVARGEPEACQGPAARVGARSRAYYEGHPRGIVLDLRWRSELDPRVLELFEARAGADNAPLAWEGRP